MTKITYVHNNPSISVEVEVTSAEKKYTLDDNPFSIPNKRVASYTGSDGNTYLPLQLIDIPTSNLTLTATMKDAGYVSVGEGSAAVDISDTVMNIVETKGKNQPFSFVTLSVSKQLFNSLNIALVQKSTKFTLNIYGIVGTWVFEKSEDSNAMYNFTLVKPAYYLKKTTLLSLLNFEIINSGTSYAIDLTNLGMAFPLSDWSDDLASFDLTFGDVLYNRSLKVYVKRNVYDVPELVEGEYQTVTKTDYSLVKISECDPDNLFRFLAQYVAEYSTSKITVRPGYYYTSIGDALLVEDIYSMVELETLKSSTTTIDNTVPDLKKVSIRLDEYCWDILQSLANLSNREIIFDDEAYFIPFVASNQKVSIDWEPSTDTSFTHIIPLSIAENDDQGSQYLVASQKVIAEAYETTVAISDTTSTYTGADIKYLAIDDTRVNSADNTLRNKQAKVVALNALLKNYKPGDCVQYSVCETTEPTSEHIISSWDDTIDPSWTDFCYRTYYPNSTYESHKTYYYKSNGKWLAVDPNVPSRTQSYNIDACLHTLRDNHNNITITNCPVAQIVTEYPACITTYTWGNPMFMDEQTQLSNLTSVSQDTVLDNTSDTAISSGDATKLVVGNQYVHQLRDDRAGFSGLIMEKNIDNNVYRLVGYDKGVVQAQFNSEGKVEAGGGGVVLDADGITINEGLSINLDHIKLSDDGLSIKYDPANISEGYTPYDALKFIDKENESNVPFRLYYTPSIRTATIDTQPVEEVNYIVLDAYTSFRTTAQYIGYFVDHNNIKTEVTSANKDSLNIIPGTTVAYNSDLISHETSLNIAYGDGAVEFDVANSTIQINGPETSQSTTLTLLTNDASNIYSATRYEYSYADGETHSGIRDNEVWSQSLGRYFNSNDKFVSGPSPVPTGTVQCSIRGGQTARVVGGSTIYEVPFIVGCSGIGGGGPGTPHSDLKLKYYYTAKLNKTFTDSGTTYMLSAIRSAVFSLGIVSTGNFNYRVKLLYNGVVLHSEDVGMASIGLQINSIKTLEIPLSNLHESSLGSFDFTIEITSLSMNTGVSYASPDIGWIIYVDSGLYNVSAEYTYDVTDTFIRYAPDSQDISYKAYKLLSVYELNKESDQRMILAEKVGDTKRIIQTFDSPTGFLLDHDATLTLGAIRNSASNPTSTSCEVSYLVQSGVGGHIGVSSTGVELNGDTRIIGGDFAQVKDSSGDRGNAHFDVTGFSVESTFSTFKSPVIALMGAVAAAGSLNISGSISMNDVAKNTLKDRFFEYGDNSDYGNNYIILAPARWNGSTRLRYGVMVCWGISERNGREARGYFHSAYASTPSVSAMGMDVDGSGGDDYTTSLSLVTNTYVKFSVPDFVERVHWIAIGLI